MWDALIIIIRIAALAVGVLLLYSLFLYEDQERALDKRIQNWLSDWWIRIDDAKESSLSAHAAFMREVARLTDAGFNRLFGNRIISFHSFGVSAWYALASLFLAISLEPFLNPQPVTLELSAVIGISLAFVVFFIFLGTLPAFSPRPVWLITWGVLVTIGVAFLLVALVGVYFTDFTELDLQGQDPKIVFRVTAISFFSMLIAVMVHVMTETLFIAITRRLLRWGAGLVSFLRIASLVVLNLVLAFLLIKAPLLLKDWAFEWRVAHGGEYSLVDHSIFLILSVFAASNLLTALFSIVFIVLGGIMLLHKLFWPVLDRPVYALQKLGFIRRKRLAFTLGIAFIGFAVGNKIPSLLKDVLGSFSG